MSKVSKSPERNTFQKEGYLKRCEKEGKQPSESYLKMWDDASKQDEEWASEERPHDMEWWLRSTDWILEKVRASDTYAQNLYSAMCNNGFIRLEVIPVLKEEEWSCSWRHSGGIIADMRQQGDYIDWYCSGIGDGLGNGDSDGIKGYVPEGCITDEIRNDLQRLGWAVAPDGDWKKFV